jgi:hypothetical protein
MAFSYNKILNIPERCVLDKKLTKAFFLKNFDLSVVEKKILNNTIQSMDWIASIKPSNANIVAIKNNDIAYEEIQVISCSISHGALDMMADKCITMIQKYIPYPIVLIIEDEDSFVVNIANKRINQVDTNKRTIESIASTAIISKLYKSETSIAFFHALHFSQLDKTNLQTTYQSYVQAIVQYQASSITGVFQKRLNSRTETDLQTLQRIETLEKEVLALSNSIKKQTQINYKVSLNIDIQNKKNEIEQLKKELGNV